MKKTLLLALIGFALGMVSCRVAPPLSQINMTSPNHNAPAAGQSYK